VYHIVSDLFYASSDNAGDSNIARDQRRRSNVSLQSSLIFADPMSASSHFSTSKLGSLDKSRSSLVVSLFYLSRSSIENSCVILACSLTKDPSLINALDWEFILSIITASLEKIHRVADVVFVGLSAMSLSFTHHFSGPKRRYASNWDNVCGEHIKFCIHCSSDLTSFHGTSAALKSLLPLCPGQSFYAQ
jgi:hypothetical protein